MKRPRAKTLTIIQNKCFRGDMKNRKESGITLVALIITIIVLIILAGITIKSIIDHNIVHKTISSTEKYAGEMEKEKTIFDKISSWFDKDKPTKPEEPLNPDVHLPGNKKIVEVGTNKNISEIIGNDKVNVIYNGNKITNTNQLLIDKYYLMYNKNTGAVEVKTEMPEIPDLSGKDHTSYLKNGASIEQDFEVTELYVIGEEYNDDIPDISGKEHTLYQRNGAKVQKDADGDYYLNFDGIDDYGQIMELEENLNFADGFEIEFVANWRSFNNWSKIIDFGNGENTNNILISNYETTNNLTLQMINNGTQLNSDYRKDCLVLNERAKYNIKYSKKEDGKYGITFRKNNQEIYATETTYILRNILRTVNYLGKSSWIGNACFNGKIYTLRVTQADGEVVLHYDIDKMLNKKKENTEIANENEWKKVIENAENGATYYGRTITLSTDLTVEEKNSAYIPTFEGTFDGNGKIINGIKINNTLGNQGLFGTINHAGTVKNTVAEGSINAGPNSGGISGTNYGNITRCKNKITVTVSNGYNAGGITAYNYGTINESCNLANITIPTAHDSIGGIAGVNIGVIKKCYNTGTISSPTYTVGGMAGHSAKYGKSGYIYNCYNNASITGGRPNYNGGIVGGWGYSGGAAYIYNSYTIKNTVIHSTNGNYRDKAYYGTMDMRNSYSTEANTKLEELNAGIDEVNGADTERPWVADTKGINDGYPILYWQLEF